MSLFLEKYLSTDYLRKLLLNLDKTKIECIQIARFVAAYYLDFLLYQPSDNNNQLFPSLYIWESYENQNDLPKSSIILDRTIVSQHFPVEYSPALPALLLVKCDHIIEAISYVDHFDDKRSAIILRLLADSIYQKDLTSEFIKTMIIENTSVEIDQLLSISESFSSKIISSISKFSFQFTRSILELDVSLQKDFLFFLEDSLCHVAEYHFSQLALETTYNYSNPVFEFPENQETSEGAIYAKIFSNLKIVMSSLSTSNRVIEQLNFTLKVVSNEKNIPLSNNQYILPRILLLMLRLHYRQIFSNAVQSKNPNLSKIADRYKSLLNDENGECFLLKSWMENASEEDLAKIEEFFNFVQTEFQMSSQLPPLSQTTRELWLRRIVFNNSTDYRDVRQERIIDWFRTICHPKYQVCDVTVSQMLLINSQWTSPGFSFITPGCHALRLSIHPHDLCIGTNVTNTNYSLSARDILYVPDPPLSEEMLFTPRENKAINNQSIDLISYYGNEYNRRRQCQTTRTFSSIEGKIEKFSKQQKELQEELDFEREFLNQTSSSNYSEKSENRIRKKDDLKNYQTNIDLSKQIEIINKKLDCVVKTLDLKEEKSIYIKEDDEESIISELPFYYENAPINDGNPIIEKLDLDLLSARPDATGSIEAKHFIQQQSSSSSPNFESMSTAQSIKEEKIGKLPIPLDWMKLLPLEEPSSAKIIRATDQINNLLIYDGLTPRLQPQLQIRKAISERSSQTVLNPNDISMINQITQTDSGFLDEKKNISNKIIKKMSLEEIQKALNRI